MNKKIPNNSYIVILPYMVNELKLKGNELLAYSLINGFSNDEKSGLQCSLSFFEKWLSCSKKTVIQTLKKLIDKDLIQKEVLTTDNSNKTMFIYRCKNYTQWCKKYTQYNIINNNTDNNTIGCKNYTNGCKKETHKNKLESLYTIIRDFSEEEIDEEVFNKVIEFFEILIKNNRLVTDEKIYATLKNLAGYSKDKQLKAIKQSIDNGWMSINPKWLDHKNKGTYNNNRTTRLETMKGQVRCE